MTCEVKFIREDEEDMRIKHYRAWKYGNRYDLRISQQNFDEESPYTGINLLSARRNGRVAGGHAVDGIPHFSLGTPIEDIVDKIEKWDKEWRESDY